MAAARPGVNIRLVEEDAQVHARDGSRGQAGDWVVVHAHTLGEPARRGLILEVIGPSGRERYRVRWDEEYESIYYPGPDATIEREAKL
jgi:hypothetical protein